jgi:hypothetical protein
MFIKKVRNNVFSAYDFGCKGNAILKVKVENLQR